jgi:phage tail-like protein
MAVLTRTDPLRDFKFTVKIVPTGILEDATPNIGNLGFAVVTGLSVTNEMIPYREGGMNTHPHKMIGQSDFNPITFSRGVFEGQDQLWRWQQFMHSWTQGALADDAGSTGSRNDYRCNIIVTVYDHPFTAAAADSSGNAGYSQDPGSLGRVISPGNKKLEFTIYNAWPAGYALGDLNAGNSSIMIQQMTVNHEGFEINWNPTNEPATSTPTTTPVAV